MNTQHDVNKKQYAGKSHHYLESSVHRQGKEFAKIILHI